MSHHGKHTPLLTIHNEHLMRDLIDRRLTELRAELEAGHRLQIDLDARQEDLRRSMLRISGAIQVLGELITASDERGNAPTDAEREAIAIANASPPIRRVVER